MAKGLVLQNVLVKNTFIHGVFEDELAGMDAENDMICKKITQRQVSEPAVQSSGTFKSFNGGYLPRLADLPEPERESEPGVTPAGEDKDQSWVVGNNVIRQMTDDAEECWPTWRGCDGAVPPPRGIDVAFENNMIKESSESMTCINQSFMEQQMNEENWPYDQMLLSECLPSAYACVRQTTEESWPTWQGEMPARVLQPMPEESWASSDAQASEVSLPSPIQSPPTPGWPPGAHHTPTSPPATHSQAPQDFDDYNPFLPTQTQFHDSSSDLTDVCADEMIHQTLPASNHRSCSKPPHSWTDVTTVMLQNLPSALTRDLLLMLLDNTGFLHSYDFIYLPIEPDRRTNKGFAFINFTNPDLALRFRSLFEGHQFDEHKLDKPLAVAPAALQGFDANYAHYNGARVTRRERGARPLFLRKPQKASLLDRSGLIADSLSRSRKLDSRPQRQEPLPPKQSKDASMPIDASKSPVPAFCLSCGGHLQCSFKFCQFCGTPVGVSA